jgi:hypothetical protein
LIYLAYSAHLWFVSSTSISQSLLKYHDLRQQRQPLVRAYAHFSIHLIAAGYREWICCGSVVFCVVRASLFASVRLLALVSLRRSIQDDLIYRLCRFIHQWQTKVQNYLRTFNYPSIHHAVSTPLQVGRGRERGKGNLAGVGVGKAEPRPFQT